MPKRKKGRKISSSDHHELQLDVVRSILKIYPSWTINDVLNTDTLYLYEIMFKKTPKGNRSKRKKKQRRIRPLSDLVKGEGGG